MRLFLDTSVLLAACGSAHGSSRALFDYAPAQRWELLASPWVVGETVRDRFAAVEAFGLDLVFKGWGRTSMSDAEILDRAAVCFDGLYQQLRK